MISPANTSGTSKLELAIIIRLPMPRLDATVSAITVPTKACVTATFSDAKKYGMVARQPDIEQNVELARLHGAHHVLEFGLRGGEPGRDVDHDREQTASAR